MKKDKLIEYIFAMFLFCIPFFDLFVSNIAKVNYLLPITLLIYILISRFFIETKKIQNVNKNRIITLITITSTLFVIIMYILGIFVGFYKNSVPINVTNFLKRILPLISVVIFTEIIRSIALSGKGKYTRYITTISLVLVDAVFNINIYNFASLEEVLAFVGYVVLASLSTNIFCNYMYKRYGIWPNVIYRVIVTSYVYVFPILPDVYLFFQSTFKIIYPYILYLLIDTYFQNNDYKMSIKSNKISWIWVVFTVSVSLILVMLVSGKFKYAVMAVGSSSMATAINKGDAVLYEKYTIQELQEGQIIVFNNNNIITIHRIIDIQVRNGDKVYYTKGDNNQQKDSGYRKNQDILGIINFKIPDIGWPTIWINNVFSRK